MKHPWTKEEKRAVLDHLGRFISSGVVPGKGPCDDCILHKKEPRGPEQSFMDCGKVFCKERGGPTKTARQKIIIPLYRHANKQSCENFILLRSDKMKSKPK